ncbi:MAG: AmmeMemoRadiSam system radical SAM enzyme, partial [Vicinamibacteria bacterium]|nr:AmmeMemoRadiSam system radical SAM enzyme [Vicinamibacteria bacterium]
NGNATPQVLDYLQPHIDCYKVDLKSFDDKHYRQLGGRLAPILETIASLHARGIWVEVVTLLVAGFNDSAAELTELTQFLAGVSPDIPWHVTAFHADYKMTDRPDTTAHQLIAAADIAKQSGLRYVYAGNRPGRVGDLENTRCAECGVTLIARRGYVVDQDRVTGEGRCPVCHDAVPGVWRATSPNLPQPART